MAVIKLVKYPDKILTRKTQPVKLIDSEIKGIVNDMFDSMYFYGGIGLAHNQIGGNLSIAVFDVKDENGRFKMALINPVLLKLEGYIYEEEGCLSFPGISFKIKRRKYAKIKGLTIEGKEVTFEATGLLAKAFQHEVDHLNGIRVIDRVRFFDRLKIRRDIARRIKAGMW